VTESSENDQNGRPNERSGPRIMYFRFLTLLWKLNGMVPIVKGINVGRERGEIHPALRYTSIIHLFKKEEIASDES